MVAKIIIVLLLLFIRFSWEWFSFVLVVVNIIFIDWFDYFVNVYSGVDIDIGSETFVVPQATHV